MQFYKMTPTGRHGKPVTLTHVAANSARTNPETHEASVVHVRGKGSDGNWYVIDVDRDTFNRLADWFMRDPVKR